MKKLSLILILFPFLLPRLVHAQATPNLSVSPTSQNAAQNSTANVAINVSNVPANIMVQFTVNYNPTYLSIANAGAVTTGGFFTGGSSISTDLSNDATGVAVIAVSAQTLSGNSGNGTIANIAFTTKAASGTSNITLSNAFYGDLSFNAVNITSFTNGSIIVGSGPAPTATPTPQPSNTPGPLPEHFECVNNACVMVAGAGTNTCSTNADCAPQPTPTTAPQLGSINISFRLQGLTTQVSAQNITFAEKYAGSTDLIRPASTVSLTPNSEGIYTYTLTGLPAQSVKLCIKGGSHLQRCFDNIAVPANQTVTVNRTTSSGDALLIGDVTADNAITSADLGAILAAYTGFKVDVTTLPANQRNRDVNHDGFVTIEDVALTTMNYSNFRLDGDE